MLGGNLGDTAEIFQKARTLLSQAAGEITAVSRIYQSEPWGMKDQPWFSNQALVLNTFLKPPDLLLSVQHIEQQLGRERTVRNGPRVIDIDILLYGNQVVQESGLTIPHPRMHLRKFNLEPLSEIAGFRIHPVLNKTIAELNDACTDILIVKPLTDNAAQ